MHFFNEISHVACHILSNMNLKCPLKAHKCVSRVAANLFEIQKNEKVAATKNNFTNRDASCGCHVLTSISENEYKTYRFNFCGK